MLKHIDNIKSLRDFNIYPSTPRYFQKIIFWFFLCIFMVGSFTEIHGQYFGRNKVRYDQFNFKILQSKHFNVYFYPPNTLAAKNSTRLIERWYSRLNGFFQYDLPSLQPLILYANHADFQQTNVLTGLISQGTGGVTEGIGKRIILPLTGTNADDDHVLGHELVHAFQYSLADSFGQGYTSLAQIPLWAVEGMAEYLTSGRNDPHTAMWLRDAVLHEDVPSVKDISVDPRYFPYRWGQAMWAFIGGKWGDDKIPLLLKTSFRTGLDSAFIKILGIDADSLSNLWLKTVEETYRPQLEGKTLPREIGQRLLAEDIDAGEMNLAPSISPDGKWVTFLSERDLFTIDLFLADARTGKVVKKLASSNRDSHYDAISFMKSSGTWSPDNQQIAFVVIRKGDYAITIEDVKKGKILQTLQFDSIAAIYDLAWSPDGSQLLFSGSQNGYSDLYLYNLNTQTLKRLTRDIYSNLQPTWSPDGKKIAFITDQGAHTNLKTLKFGEMQIAVMNLTTGSTEVLSLFPRGKHINPQFSPDGSSLYFVANPDGVSNIYRLSLDDYQIYQITNIATGISGITALSPCLTVSRENQRMLFSVFEKGQYNVYALEGDALTGTPIFLDLVMTDYDGILPPIKPLNQDPILQYLQNPMKEVVSDTLFKISEFRPSFGLRYIGQASIGLATDRFGTSIGGGISMLFSDVLNDHILGLGLQMNGGLKDFGGEVVYQNLKKRPAWGAAISHIPYRIEQTFLDLVTINIGGTPVVAQQLSYYRQRVFNDRILLLGEYPLSINRRVEGTIGYNRIWFDNEIEQITFIGDQILERKTISLPSEPGLDLMQTSLAYVGDYSFFGFTSPVNGSRYRFEVEGTVGSLNFATFLADYRKYLFHNPFTLAFRFLHYGRYFGDSESSRLTPLFIGYETYVRGYSPESYDVNECTDGSGNGDCPEFDRLLGSRMAIFNTELRIALFGTRRLGLINFPVMPTELVFFFDGGAAWTSSQSIKLKWKTNTSERVPVFSAGVALRFNIFNILIPQVYYAFPFQRPQKKGLFGFVLAVGW